MFDLIKILMIADNQSYLLLVYPHYQRELERIKFLTSNVIMAKEWKLSIKFMVAEKLNTANKKSK